MTIAILHISDIHFSTPSDPINSRVKNIAAAIIPNLREATSLVVLVSGDIAQAGMAEEYSIAESFVNSIIREISGQSDVKISVVLAPGNHDVIFLEIRMLGMQLLRQSRKRYLQYRMLIYPLELRFKKISSHLGKILKRAPSPFWMTLFGRVIS